MIKVLLAFAVGIVASQDRFMNPEESRHLAMNQGGMTSTYTGTTTTTSTAPTKPSQGAASKPTKPTKSIGSKAPSKSTSPVSKPTTAGKSGARP